MAFEPIPAMYRATFQDNVLLACQQTRSRLLDYCTFHPNLKGEQARAIQIVAQRTARRNSPRGGATPRIEGRMEDVYITPEKLDDGFLEDKEDDIKLVTDLLNPNLQAMAAAHERGKDAIISESWFGPRRTGKNGLVVEPYNNPNGIVAHDYVKTGAPTASGLTFSKIVRAVSLLSISEADLMRDKAVMAITNVQMEDLYAQVQFTSADFRNKMVLDTLTETVVSFMGVEFVRLPATLIPTITLATRRRNPLWLKSGLHYGEFMPLMTTMDRDPTQNFNIQAYSLQFFGATRSEDVKVVEVHCNEV
jgi:hypothetical protein